MRYFFEVSYRGTNYAGFQIQKNANTVQAELEKALQILFRQHIPLTGSSRTDAGVHAIQNYFHGEVQERIDPKAIYNLNAILPNDIVLKSIVQVNTNAHCRFDATSREYHYIIYDAKNPFLLGFGYYYPYKLDIDLLMTAACIIQRQTNFKNFCKTNVQVNNYNCSIFNSEWQKQNEQLLFIVKGNRFLRGMVRALVATMLRVGTKKISLTQFESLFTSEPFATVDFSSPPHALYLASVKFPAMDKTCP